MKMFMNTEEDSEVRIKAYLAVMQCPTSEVLYQVKQTLASEQVNQVRDTRKFTILHFIWLILF